MTLDEFQRLLSQAGPTIERKISVLLHEEAAETSRDAKRRAPRRTGELAAGIFARVLDDQRIELGATSPYAAIQEYGGIVRGSPLLKFQIPSGQWRSVRQIRIPARPYLRPALAAADDRLADRLEALVLEVLDGQ